MTPNRWRTLTLTGFADVDGREVGFAGWNYPLARATGLGAAGGQLGELLAANLGVARLRVPAETPAPKAGGRLLDGVEWSEMPVGYDSLNSRNEEVAPPEAPLAARGRATRLSRTAFST